MLLMKDFLKIYLIETLGPYRHLKFAHRVKAFDLLNPQQDRAE